MPLSTNLNDYFFSSLKADSRILCAVIFYFHFDDIYMYVCTQYICVCMDVFMYLCTYTLIIMWKVSFQNALNPIVYVQIIVCFHCIWNLHYCTVLLQYLKEAVENHISCVFSATLLFSWANFVVVWPVSLLKFVIILVHSVQMLLISEKMIKCCQHSCLIHFPTLV